MDTTTSFIKLLSSDESKKFTKKDVYTAYHIYCENNHLCHEKVKDFHNKLKKVYKISILDGHSIYRIDIKNYSNQNKCYILDNENKNDKQNMFIDDDEYEKGVCKDDMSVNVFKLKYIEAEKKIAELEKKYSLWKQNNLMFILLMNIKK